METRVATRPWLWFSVPIALLGTCTSLAGLFIEATYARETENWTAQGMGQDIANLVMFAAMAALAWMAARGSVRAHLAWIGTLVYTAYAYAIYAFAVHFNRLFLAYVAVFGLAIWALIGSLTHLDAAAIRARFDRPPVRTAGSLLIVLATLFALLWLSGIIPASVDNQPPQELLDVDLPSNPVHVLDLAVFLPTMFLTGLWLLRDRAWGYVLTPVVLTAVVGISLGIVTLTFVSAARGQETAPGPAAFVGIIMLIELGVLVRFLRNLR